MLTPLKQVWNNEAESQQGCSRAWHDQPQDQSDICGHSTQQQQRHTSSQMTLELTQDTDRAAYVWLW
jgi:hypothetical protein